jgi:UbiD family decarboxylase
MQEPVQLVECETVDVEVPARAEMVIEGEIPPHIRENEGPFGEYTGYATGRSTNHVLNVRAITFRKNAIYQDIVPGNSSEHLLLGRVSKEAHIFRRMKEAVPNLKSINWPRSGTHFHSYLSLSEPIDEGQANHAALLLLGLDSYLKLVVVVDEDIDVYNEEEVLWAVATRMQPDRDINVVKNVFCNKLDPSAYGEGTSAKLIIDATKKGRWTFDKLTFPKEALDKARQIVKNYKI